MTALELFNRASEAVRDAELCARQLEQAEETALRPGSPSLEAVTLGGTMNHDRMERRIVGSIRLEEKLRDRVERDWQTIDLATAVLYGTPELDGVVDLAPHAFWADAVFHRYLGLRKWNEVAGMLSFDKRYTQTIVRSALGVADSYNLVALHARHHGPDGWEIFV